MSPRNTAAKQQQKESQKAGQEGAEAVADRTGIGDAKTDPEALRRDIEQTREDLGDTVEALSEKADVKGQAQAKLEERKQALRQKQAQAKEQVSQKQAQAKEQVSQKQAQAREQVSQLRERLSSATPEDVKSAATQGATMAKERPIPAIAGAFALGFAIAWMIKRA